MRHSSGRFSWCHGLLLGALSILLSSVTPGMSQSWQHVIQLGGHRGSAIGGGSGNTLYAGLGSGHVLRSDDNGQTWIEVTHGLVDNAGRMLLPKAFVVTPTGRVLRGGDNASWQNKAGSPVFHSDDRGGHWNEVPLPFGSSARNPGGIGISDLVLHQGAVYFSDLLSEGVWKSTDDGNTWTAVGGQLPTVPFIGFAKTYYALASAGDALLTVESTRGVFRSTDGGASWAQAVNGISGVFNSPLLGGRTWSGTDVVGAPDGTAFAVVDNRLYRSRDAGASWVEVGAGVFESPNPFVPSVIQPSARKVELLGDRVYVSTTDGSPRFFEGTTLGASWAELPRIPVGGEPGSILGQSFSGYQGALYFAGTNGIHRLELSTAARMPVRPRVTVTPSGPMGMNLGSTLRATATVIGTAPYTFEWRINDLTLAGQTAPELAFTPTSLTQAGMLTVVVGNAAGLVTNTVGPVSIAPISPGAVDYTFRPVVSTNGFQSGLVTTFAFGPDGSVFLGGAMASATELYAGVRRVFADGTPDPAFVTGAATGSGTGPGISSGRVRSLLPLRDGSVLVGAADTSEGGRYYRRLLADGSVDATWPWPVSMAGGPRKIVRLEDGRLLVGGGSDGGLHRLLSDGTLDPSFQGPVSLGRFQRNFVSDFQLLPDGRILIAGAFAEIDGIQRVGVARLESGGSLDRSWAPAAIPNGSEVNALAVLPDGRILIGGAFVTVGGQPHRNLALLRADGSIDPSLADIIPNTNPAGIVNAFAVQPDGRTWVGGTFSGVSGRTYLFRLSTDGTVDTGFPDLGFMAGREGGVTSLAFTPDGRLWIGCGVTQVGDSVAGQLFRIFTDVEGPTLGYAGLDRTPALGEQVTLRGTVTGPRTGLHWRFQGAPIPGATSLEWSLGPVTLANSGAYDLVVTSAGGSHTSAPVNVRVRGQVVFDRPPASVVGLVSNSVIFTAQAFGILPLGYQWSRDGAELAGATNQSLTLTNLQLAMAGDYALRVTGGDGSSLTSDPAYLTVIPVPGSTDRGFRPALFAAHPFTAFKDIEFLPDGRVLVLGNFATVTNGPNVMLARLLAGGALDPDFAFDATGLTETVAMARHADGKLYVIVRSNGYTVRRLNENGSVDPSYAGPDLHFPFDLVVEPDGRVLVVGLLGIVRLQANGEPDTDFNLRAKLGGEASSVSADPAGRIYVAGQFTTVGGKDRRHIARLLPDGSLDASFAPTNFLGGGVVRAQEDGVLFGNNNVFVRFDETGRHDPGYGWSGRLGAWDLNAAGLLVGVLPTSTGDGVLRNSRGRPASPVSTMKVPTALYGYAFLRVAPDGAFWLGLASAGGSADPVTMLHRLQGTVTPLALVTSPQSQTVNRGTSVTFSAAATGTSRVRYQWWKDGVELPGQTQSELVLLNVQAANQGSYSVLVANQSGSQRSRAATLVVLGAPEIVGFSGAGNLNYGDALPLAVEARGIAPLTYQWRRNGTPIPGATLAQHTVRSVVPSDAGSYDVLVSNALGTASSVPIRVTVAVRAGAVVSTFTGGAAGAGMELNVLPNGDFLVDDKAYNRFGELLFRLAFPDGTSTVLRDRIRVDTARSRIVAGPTRRVRAYDFGGKVLPGYAGPVANVRMVRIEAGGTVLQSTEGLNFPLQRLDDAGTVSGGFSPAVRPSLDMEPLPDGKLLVLGFTQRTVSGRIVYNTTLHRLLTDGSLDATFLAQTNVFPGGGQASRMAIDGQGRILVLGGTGVAETNQIVRLSSGGVPDSSFAPSLINGDVHAVAEQANGKLVIVGAFTRVGGLPRRLLARLNSDGSHDTTFDPGTGLTQTSGQNVAHDVAILPAGEIVVTGTFGFADDQPRKGLAMFVGDVAEPVRDAFAEWLAAAGLSGDVGQPEADPDKDGFPNIAEFAYGTPPHGGGELPKFEGTVALVEGVGYPAVAFVRRQDLGDVQITVRVAASVLFAGEVPAETVSVTPLGNGLERVVVRGPEPASPDVHQFFRFTVTR